MRIRHAVGATALALTVVATLSSCADDPKDKAFGGGDAPAPPTDLPTLPSLNPSGLPTGMPDGSSSGLSSGGSSGLSSGGSDARPSVRPTYNSNAIGEVVGQDCKYDRTTGRMTYEVDIQNESNEMAFRYNFTVVFKVGVNSSSTVASRTIASRPQTVTVNAGGDRTVNAYTTYNNNNRFVYSCRVSTARKYPTS